MGRLAEEHRQTGHGADAEGRSAPGRSTETLRAPVVWVSGFSASGKTTVGRKVEALLQSQGTATVMLDGDDLRSILAGKWGYSRAERIELARVYFRLCSHLASQGLTVVICAVAMYDEVRDWLKEHVPAAIEVFLNVPEEERRDRDRRTKGIYDQLGSQAELYDQPTSPDLVVANYGDVTADAAALRIVEQVARTRRDGADHGRADHWQRFYSSQDPPLEPSSFAEEVAASLGRQRADLLEVGCGNGRDAHFFAKQGPRVMALDRSPSAIEAARAQHNASGLTFHQGTIADLPLRKSPFDALYNRFCLHAMTPEEEDELLHSALHHLRPGGRLFIECRSINDPLARCGEVISKTERLFGHYRRFIIGDDLLAKLTEIGFQIDSFQEAAGLTPLGDDDPVVIRLHASIPR